MLISARPLKNFQNINSYLQATEWTVRKDEPKRIYLQLVDLEQDGLRYLSQATAYSLSVTFPALNPLNAITKAATQASALDRSIWYVDLSANENPSTGSVKVSITEDGVTKSFSMMSALTVELLNDGGC